MIRDLLQVLRDMFSRTQTQDWHRYYQPHDTTYERNHELRHHDPSPTQVP